MSRVLLFLRAAAFVSVFALICVSALLNPDAIAEPNQSVGYYLDGTFVYADQLKRSNSSSDKIDIKKLIGLGEDTKKNNSNSTNDTLDFARRTSSPERTLGLKHLMVGLKASAHEQSSLHLVFRPDASLKQREVEGKVNEYDGRAGKSYRNKPEINLLDLYQLNFYLSASTYVSLGVFDQIVVPMQAYKSPLEYGLEVLFPRKTSAVLIHYDLQGDVPPLAQPILQRPTQFYLWVFNGDEDRGERISYKSSSFDEGPVSQDPYLGLGFDSEISFDDLGRLGIFAALLDTKVESGKVNEAIGRVAYNTDIKLGDKPMYLNAEYRVARERWSLLNSRLGELTQQSLALTSLTQINPDSMLALGIHQGISERHVQDKFVKETQKGYQFDLGILYAMVANVESKFFVSTESRSSTITPANDGFTNSSSATAYLMRIAFEITYTLNRP